MMHRIFRSLLTRSRKAFVPLLAMATGLAPSLAAHAQISSGQYSYDSVNHAFFITGSAIYGGFAPGDDRLNSDFFVGKDNATDFNTITSPRFLQLIGGVNNASILGYGNYYPVGGPDAAYYRGLSVFGNSEALVRMNSFVSQVNGYNNSVIGVTDGGVADTVYGYDVSKISVRGVDGLTNSTVNHIYANGSSAITVNEFANVGDVHLNGTSFLNYDNRGKDLNFIKLVEVNQSGRINLVSGQIGNAGSGTTGQGLIAGDLSTVNIMGGTVTYLSTVSNASLNLSGGRVKEANLSGFFDMTGGELLQAKVTGFDNTIHGGSVNTIEVNGQGSLDILAGTVVNALAYDTSILNISGGQVTTDIVLGDYAKANLSDTANVNTIYATNRSEVTVSQGSAHSITASDFATVHVLGGSVAFLAVANSTAAYVSGGTVTTADTLDGSVLEVSGGTVSNLTGHNASTIQFSGGTVSDVVTQDTSAANLTGGKIGNVNSRDSSTVNTRGSTTFNHINSRDTSTVNIAGGSIENVDSFNSSTTNIQGGAIGGLNSHDSSTVNVSGGTFSLANIYDNSHVTISNGTFNGFCLIWNNSQVDVSGGNFTGYLATTDTSLLNVSGGTINNLYGGGNSVINVSGGSISEVFALENSAINITGGTIGQHTIHLFDEGIVNLSGSSLSMALSGSGSDDFGAFLDYILSGALADGTSLDGVHVKDYDGGFSIADPSAGTGNLRFYTVIPTASAAPEPGSLALLSLSLLGIGLRLRRRRSTYPRANRSA